MILVDSSICIAYLRKRLGPEAKQQFCDLVLNDKIAINRLIWAELFGGIKNKREERDVEDLVSLSHMLEFDQECWQTTAQLNRRCILAGVNVPLSDIQIQACADRYGIELFHNDKHFGFIQSTAS